MANQMLADAEKELGLGPVAMARAMNTNYDTYKHWRSRRSNMTGASARCLELLLMYPRTAKRLAEKKP